MNDEHAEAQELSVRAAGLIVDGRTDDAQRLFARAAELEAQALAAIPDGGIRTRSVLSVSLGSLLYKAGLLPEAERTIFGLLAAATLDPWAERQLRDLLGVVGDELVLLQRLGRRYVGEAIAVALRGGEIGVHTGPLDLILEKANGFQSLVLRMAEWVGRLPLRRTGAPPRDLQDLISARAGEPAGGSYVLEIRLTEPVQPDLFEGVKVPPVVLSDQLFGFLESVATGLPEDVEKVVPDADYRRALLQLTRNILPEGKRVHEIGISRMSNRGLQSVYLTDDLRPRIRRVTPRPALSVAESETTHRGVLRGLHLDRHWLILALADGTHVVCDTVPDLLDDVVGPMVNRQVTVSGTHRGGRGRLLVNDIELTDNE